MACSVFGVAMNELRDLSTDATMESLRPSHGESMTESELKFPEWQEPLREAILERDPKQLAEKTRKIETLIRERLQHLRTNGEVRNSSRSVEQQALVDALNVIRIVLRG